MKNSSLMGGQINPLTIIKRRWLIPATINGEQVNPLDMGPSLGTKVAQNGIDCCVATQIVLQPKSFQNVAVCERFRVPKDVLATLFVRSSLSRQGVFLSSGVYDSGYGFDSNNGAAGGVSLYNMSEVVVEIPQYTRICQAIFWIGCSYQQYNGHYNHTNNISAKSIVD